MSPNLNQSCLKAFPAWDTETENFLFFIYIDYFYFIKTMLKHRYISERDQIIIVIKTQFTLNVLCHLVLIIKCVQFRKTPCEQIWQKKPLKPI